MKMIRSWSDRLSPAKELLRGLFASTALLLLLAHSAKGDTNDPLVFSTKECYLTEPVYGHKFEFNHLNSELAHVVTSSKGDTFEYNICGNLSKPCDGQSNVAACLSRGNNQYILGRQHELHYQRGKMFFNYSNGSACPNGTGTFQLHVSVSCDYTLDQIQSHVTGYASEQCSFYINLETPLACLPVPDAVQSNSCTVRDTQTGHTFDLLPLGDYNHRISDRAGSYFVINVCKPVLYGENAMCPSKSSVCFVPNNSTDYKKKYLNYGTVQPAPIFENDKLLMRLTSPTPCNGIANYTTNIYFFCDERVKNVHPEYVGQHGCVHEFNFATPLACNNLKPCTAIRHGNEILDMSAFKDKPFILDIEKKNYTIAVCSNAGQPCLENDGACVSENNQTTSLGIGNSNLRFNQTGTPYLLYENGAPCQKSDGTSSHWSTKIEFVCVGNATKNNGSKASASDSGEHPQALGPKIIENSNCEVLVHYQTSLACRDQITCKAKAYAEHTEDGTSEEVVDLTPLISTVGNYEAKIELSSSAEQQQVPKTTKFFLNVCRPLVSTYQLSCAGGSGACMAKVGASGSPEEEQSLGFPMASLVAVNRTMAQLLYTNGDTCPTDKNLTLSTGIDFYCDMRAGRGSPVLRSISDCQYQFQWATSVICPPHNCSYRENTCEIVNDETKISFNLKTAGFTQDGKIKIQQSNGEFTLDLCGPFRDAVTDYSQDLVNLFFNQSGPCGDNGVVNVQMRLICSKETNQATSFSDDSKCNLLYVQHTPDICSFLGLKAATTSTTSTTEKPSGGALTTANPNGNNNDHNNNNTSRRNNNNDTGKDNNSNAANSNDNNHHPEEQTGSIGTILAAILSLTFFVACIGVLAFSPERRQSLRRLFRRSTSAVRYSRVQSNEEANLLLEPNGEFTDSDDDMLL